MSEYIYSGMNLVDTSWDDDAGLVTITGPFIEHNIVMLYDEIECLFYDILLRGRDPDLPLTLSFIGAMTRRM